MTSLCGNWTAPPLPGCYVELACILSSASVGYVTLLLSIYLRCSKRGKRKENWNLFTGHVVRCVLSIVLFLLHLSEVGELATGGSSWVLTVASMFSWAGVQFFYITTEKFGRVQYLAATSILYLTVGLSRSVLLYTLLDRIDMTYVATVLAALTSTVSYASALNDLVTLIKEIKLDRDERKAPSRDYESYCHNRAHWYSQVTFFWLTPLLRMGFDNPLELEDLGRLPRQESTSEQYNKFQQNYLKLKGSDGVASLWKCYAHCYWRNFAVGGILKLVGDSVGLVAPLGISIVIDYVELSGSTSRTGQDSFVTLKSFFSNGYVMTIIIFLSTIAQGSFSQASTHVINVEGIRLKTALQGTIYAKTLKLSVCKRDDESISSDKVGNASNLMSEDTFNIMTCLWIGHYTWAIPLKISALMYLLYCKLGISAVIGALCCIIIMTPMQFWIGKKMSDNTKIIANLDDERLRLTNEMLQGIKVLKLCGWEEVFRRKLMVSRARELKYLDKDSLYWALMTFLTHSSSSVITLITLGTFYYLGGSHLSAANVFSALALFNQLTVPLFIFPITVPIIISALVSTRRIEDYLAMPEATSYFHQDDSDAKSVKMPPLHSQEKLGGGGGLRDIMEETESYGDLEEDRHEFIYSRNRGMNACVLREAYFSWADSDKPSLFISCLNIPKGELTAVIGKVGSGKTSFLNALLGEMKCTKGLMKWEKGTNFAYVSQQPWLLNATIRENILMGLSYKAKRFAKVISATALVQDIETLPNKDLTELSDKGINLSGGQRQRIAIARALYSRANVIILDDPLSALDYHVSQHVFEQGIINLILKHKKTVVMVTHSLHLLTYANKVVALENGKIRACGKLRDMELVDGVVTGIDPGLDTRGRTARERWQLVKLVSRIGHHIRQQNIKLQNKQLFIPFRKRMSITSEYYWMQDLPLPNALEDDADDSTGPTRGSSTLPRHRPVARASSLQPHSSSGGPMNPVTRQASSPTINQGSRQRTYTFDAQNCGSSGGGHLFKNIFTSNKVQGQQGTRNIHSSGETPQTGSFKEKNVLRRLMSSASFKSIIFNDHEKHAIRRLPSTCSDYSDDYHADEEENLDPDWCGTNTFDEREYGTISTEVYITYLKSCGILISAAYIILAVTWQATRVYTDFWLSSWTHESAHHSHSQTLYYLTMYTVLSLACVLISLLSNLFGQWAGAKARKRLHNELVFSVLRLPIKIFEITPLGRILARFSTDINLIDKKLATSVQRLMQFLLLCFSAILVNSIVTPWFLILAVPICLMYYIVQKFYRCSSRELQRLDSMSRTPIISHLTETLSGLETIRGFRQQKRFTSAMFSKLDTHTNAFLIANSAARWLGIALDYLGAFIVLLAMLVCLFCSRIMPEVVTAALVGLAINYTLLVPIYLNWVVKFLSDVESYMASVERICHYIRMTPENYKTRGVVPRVWPSKGEIRFESVSLRYDQSAEMAISNITLVIPAGQKVGICGRTGSGKSSLVMSLFGMTPVTDGHIYIDGVNISAVPLKTLRTRLSVIPQDIIMFSGTIRENLDMENRFTDAELWEALSLSQMKDVVITQLGGLNGQVREGGVNLSMGQHQLLCLARAILHKTVCLIMDEATSSLDLATEKTLLLAAEKAFANKTVITIAHRLTSLLSCDRILVLESGRIVEDGSPNELLNRSMGIFSSMLRACEDRRMQ